MRQDALDRGFHGVLPPEPIAAQASLSDLGTASITSTAQQAARRTGILSLPAKTLPEVLQHTLRRHGCGNQVAEARREISVSFWRIGVRIKCHSCHGARERVSLYPLLGVFRHTMICLAPVAQPGGAGVTAEVAAGRQHGCDTS
jgi:hypothetical protein